MTQTFRETVIGAWTLLENTRETKEGERYYFLGTDATVYLMYTPDGYLSATLSRASRSALNYSNTGDLHTGTAQAANA